MNLSQSNTPLSSKLSSPFSYEHLDLEEKINRFLDQEGVFMEESPLSIKTQKSIKPFKSIATLSSPLFVRRKERKLTNK